MVNNFNIYTWFKSNTNRILNQKFYKKKETLWERCEAMMISIIFLVFMFGTIWVKNLLRIKEELLMHTNDSLIPMEESNRSEMLKKQLDDFFANSIKENNVSLGSKVSIYKFSRGEKYSCIVKVINDGEHVTFDKIIAPMGTSEELLSKLITEAETFALDMNKKEVNKQWSTS